MKKKSDNAVFPSTGEHGKRHIGGWITPGVFVPVRVDDSYENSKRPFIPQPPSLWERLLAWVRYYSIQLRWDIERWLVRRFKRR